MILILEATSPPMTGPARHTFHEDGGRIGRESDNAWVLPHSKVSGLHAVISHRNSVFYIEDRSRNGVFLNSSKNRLERGRPQPIKSGDRILIDPYEIRVTVTREQGDRADRAEGALSASHAPPPGFDATNPFDGDDPFAPHAMASPVLQPPDMEASHEELDPLELLNLKSKPVAQRNAPKARDLDRASLLEGHYQPPAVVPESSFDEPASANVIPEGYDPLAPDDVVPLPPPPRPRAPMPPPPPPAPPPAPRQVSREPEERPSRAVEERPAPPAPPPFTPVEVPLPPVEDIPPVRERAAPPVISSPPAGSVDFASVLAGAGLDPGSITPEVAHEFGRILRVVVSGVMDVMRSRQQIKDEFRMQGTRVRRLDNNPLKFSADVDDALHNLLMKRNSAYMSPVEAFDDAFADLRNHQIAMLAGMRTAFESMLEEFDPDRLQQEFDRQLNKGLVPAKMRYWDSYRERQEQARKDPEATFRHLFGEHFARAYEDQLKALKAREGQPASGGSNTPKAPDN